MATRKVTIYIDEVLKKQAEELFSSLNLSLNDAFIMFIKQVIYKKDIPFEINKNNISIVPDEVISNVSLKLIEKNREAYEELAK